MLSFADSQPASITFRSRNVHPRFSENNKRKEALESGFDGHRSIATKRAGPKQGHAAAARRLASEPTAGLQLCNEIQKIAPWGTVGYLSRRRETGHFTDEMESIQFGCTRFCEALF